MRWDPAPAAVARPGRTHDFEHVPEQGGNIRLLREHNAELTGLPRNGYQDTVNEIR